MLASAGAIAGLTMAAWLTPALLQLSDIDVPGYAAVSIDTSVLAMTVVTALLCGLLFGLAGPFGVLGRSASATPSAPLGSRGPHEVREFWPAWKSPPRSVLAASALLMLQSFADHWN